MWIGRRSLCTFFFLKARHNFLNPLCIYQPSLTHLCFICFILVGCSRLWGKDLVLFLIMIFSINKPLRMLFLILWKGQKSYVADNTCLMVIHFRDMILSKATGRILRNGVKVLPRESYSSPRGLMVLWSEMEVVRIAVSIRAWVGKWEPV